MITKLLPLKSKKRRMVKKFLQLFGWIPSNPYDRLMYERKDKIELFEVKQHNKKPLISIVVPAYNTPKKYLYPFIRSVISQTYQNWELVIVNASDIQKKSRLIDGSVQYDNRIRVINVSNEGISKNTNIGIDAAKGAYVGFMDHDDILEPNALDEVVDVINKSYGVDLIYTDEDKISEDGTHYLEPHFKPDWSPHLLTQVNYITHFTVVKRSILKKLNGLDADKDGAQDYDLMLRIADSGATIKHIPKILYHWRVADNSTAECILNKPYVFKSGVKALNEHYKRNNIRASAIAIANAPGFYRSNFKVNNKINIILTPFANETLIKKYASILMKNNIIGNNRLITPYEVSENKQNIVVNYINQKQYIVDALKYCNNNVVLINRFIIPQDKHWLNNIVGLLSDNSVKAVSPAILSEDGIIIDMGLINVDNEKRLLFSGFSFGESTIFGNTTWTRNVDELTGDIVAVRPKELLDFIENREHLSMNKIINSFSSFDIKNKFNVVLPNEAVIDLKYSFSNHKYKNAFFNENIYFKGGNLNIKANNQQIQDALAFWDERLQ